MWLQIFDDINTIPLSYQSHVYTPQRKKPSLYVLLRCDIVKLNVYVNVLQLRKDLQEAQIARSDVQQEAVIHASTIERLNQENSAQAAELDDTKAQLLHQERSVQVFTYILWSLSQMMIARGVTGLLI